MMQAEVDDGAASVDVAHAVLLHEAQAMARLSDKFSQNRLAMQRAVHATRAARGKLVLVGVGKSGLIARKIASTLTSLGTLACFLHPVEALHGDIGVVQPGEDVIMALSYSGESPELLTFMQRPQSQRCVRIVMSANPRGRLVPLGDIWLDCGSSIEVTDAASGPFSTSSSEACPYIPAPTTSTTTMLALGDAFSMALTHAKGIQCQTFFANHPGGNLGQVFPMQQRLSKN